MQNALFLVVFSALMLMGQSVSANYKGYGADSVESDVLAKFAPQPLPGALSRDIQSRMDVLTPTMGAVSPDGRHLCTSWNITGTWQVWCLDRPNSFPRQLTGGDDYTGFSGFTPDGKTILISRDRKGEENQGLYYVPLMGGKLEVIQHKAGVQTYLERIGNDGLIYFKANDRRPGSRTIYTFDFKTKEIKVWFDRDGLWSIQGERQGKFLIAKSTGFLWREYYEFDPSNETLIPLLGQGENEEYKMAYAAQPGKFIVLTNKFGNFKRLYRWSQSDGFWPLTSNSSFDVSDFTVDRELRRILYTTNEKGFTRVAGLNAKTYKLLEMPKFPHDNPDHVYNGSNSWGGRYTTFGVGVPTGPDLKYVYDWKGKKLTQWFKPSAPEIDIKGFVPAKLEYYSAADGTQIPMLVRRPKACNGTKLCPVIVEFHGGPEDQATPGFKPYTQMFVDHGFIYVEPNVRGSEGYGKEWIRSDDGVKRLQVITDIRDAAVWIKEHWRVNGQSPKVGVTGSSYGGYSTLIAMTMFAGVYDAGVSEVGMSNLVTFLENTAPYRRSLRVAEYGDPQKDREALLKLSPISHIDHLKSPLLMIQGASDPRVPVGEAIQMYEAAVSRGVVTKLIIFPDEGHGLSKRGNQVLGQGHTLLWFKKYLAD